MVADLTGLEVRQRFAAGRVRRSRTMTMCKSGHRCAGQRLFRFGEMSPADHAVVQARAEPLGYEVVVGDHATYDFSRPTFGALVQCRTRRGNVGDYAAFAERAHTASALVMVRPICWRFRCCARPVSSAPTSSWAAASASAMPMGYGGPHAAFWRHATSISASCKGGWWACRSTVRGNRRCATTANVSSTSAATKLRATSARRRCCWR